MSNRLDTIHGWLHNLQPNIDLKTFRSIPTDASARKYYRVETPERSLIIMDTEPGADLVNFVRIDNLLIRNGLHVPKILRMDINLGLLVLEDFGNQTYLSVLNSNTADGLYHDALQALVKIQLIPEMDDWQLQQMDESYIANKLNVFQEWYLEKALNLEDSNSILGTIQELQQIFSREFRSIPHNLVHLDYHSRNLMYVPENNPGVLDFQDAMFGPITYDLVSLLQDAYLVWPRNKVIQWVKSYKVIAESAGVMRNISEENLIRSFDIIGLQRHLKNLGVFARLNLRDKKPEYLNSIPTLLDYITDTCKRYSELSFLQDFLETKILPKSMAM